MSTEENLVQAVKEKVTAPLPKPPSLHQKAEARELKSRLEWGEPALTILDVRDRAAFNRGHIMGAMAMPLADLSQLVQGINRVRDLYVYGESTEETAQAASQLREAGFQNVAELQGGLDAWKMLGGPTEGPEENVTLNAGAFNVVSRVSQHLESQGKKV
jgi:rhodanese-related sulfurtransferase